MTNEQARMFPATPKAVGVAGHLKPGTPKAGGGSLSLPRPAGAQQVPEPAFLGLASYIVGLYLSLHAFFAPEFMPLVIGAYFPLVAMLALLLPCIWLAASPQPLRFMRTGIWLPYIALAGWFLVSAVVMSFKGYILDILAHVVRFYTAPLIFCGLLVTTRHVAKAIFGYWSGFAIALLFCWKFGAVEPISGRFIIRDTSLGNPNDLALNLLFGLAFSPILLVKANVLKRLVFLGFFLVTLYFAAKTGSRANFLTAGVLFIAAWAVATAKARMIMLVSVLAAGVVLIAVVPKSTWVRMTTFFSVSSEMAEDRRLSSAVGSTEARKQLQIRAVILTFQNPIFGVGPRMFIYALNDYAVEVEGRRKGSWQHPHNTYLDISAETGLVGLGLYLSCIIWCLRTNYRSVRAVQRRPDLQPVLTQSCCLLFASVVFSFGTLFCSIPYLFHLPFLLGLTAANWLALQEAGAFGMAPARLPRQLLPKRVGLASKSRQEGVSRPVL